MIFSDMVEEIMKVFMDDFSVFRSFFFIIIWKILLWCSKDVKKIIWCCIGKMPLHGARRHCSWSPGIV